MLGFCFTVSDWLAYPAFQLAGFQHSNWLASSALIGHNYTLIYTVTMYSLYTLPLHLCIISLFTFYSLWPLSFPSRSLFLACSILSHLLFIFLTETSDLFFSFGREIQLHKAFISLFPNILPLYFITNFSFPPIR